MENTFNEKQARRDYQMIVSQSSMNTIGLIISLCAIIGFIGLFSSIIFWVWLGWSIAWRVFLTSLVVFILFSMFQKGYNNGIKEAENKFIENLKNDVDISVPKGFKQSKFQKRLNDMVEERKKQNNW